MQEHMLPKMLKEEALIMKKLATLLTLTLLVGMLSIVPASAEGSYGQAPMLEALVESGEIPAIEERLPENPRVIHEILDEYLDPEIGEYGGTMRFVADGPNWDADIFIGMTENLLTMASANSDDITANIVESYEVNDELTEYTFTLRKGLKWSDGVEVTMEDFEFAINDVIFNEEITPVVAAYMRDAGSADGDPFTFEVVDDYTFKISFKKAYGGFPVHISIAGWKGYTDLLKPAHFLKQFHIAYAEECHGSLDAYYEFLQPYATCLGYDDVTEEDTWVQVFNQVDMTNWECTDPSDFLTSVTFADAGQTENFPHLYPWTMISSENNINTWERNPYYFKVDEDGNQLPYIDYLTSTLVEDQQMIQLKVMTGEVDFMREAATLDNVSLYKENEENANITAYITDMHVNPCAVNINLNYGLNTDGTVKDDADSQAWQEMVQDIRFRQALMHAIDAEEVIESVFTGMGDVSEYFACDGDTDTANALLDEMGAVDVDGDGYRETPSGKKFQWQMWQANETSEQVKVCELYAEYWQGIGLNVQVYSTDGTLLDSSRQANEIPMRIIWLTSNAMWHYQEWYTNMPLWDKWVTNGGLNGTLVGNAEYLEPPQEWKDFVLMIQSCFTTDPTTAVNETVPALMQIEADTLWNIIPFERVQQCVVINSDVGNIPTGGVGISWNFALEQMFFEAE